MPRAITASKAFTPGRIGDLDLRNRLIRAGCFEGMSQGGRVIPALIEHHRRVAGGGTAMTTVASCSVSSDGRAFDHQLWMRDRDEWSSQPCKSASGSALWVSSSLWYNGSPASLPEKAGIKPTARSLLQHGAEFLPQLLAISAEKDLELYYSNECGATTASSVRGELPAGAPLSDRLSAAPRP